MILRELKKKMKNISIVLLKINKKKYEVAVYSNKLYEYRNNKDIDLEKILPSINIYKSVETGELVNESEIKSQFGLDIEMSIRKILDKGREQKPKETAQYELEKIEKQLVKMVQEKVLYNGEIVPEEILRGVIKSVWNIKNTDLKKQVSKVILLLESVGFTRLSYKVLCSADLPDINYEKTEDGQYIIPADELPVFLKTCDDFEITYVITQDIGIEEEEIC